MDVYAFENETKRILHEVEEECGWMYETLHVEPASSRLGKDKGRNKDRSRQDAGSTRRRLKEVRIEALRAGFKSCWEKKDFQTIIIIGDRIPQNLLLEDEQLLMFYDIAKDRT